MLMSRSTATRRVNISKHEKQDNDEKEDHLKGQDMFEDKQSAVMPSEITEQAPFEEKVLSERMRNKEIPMEYHDKKVKLQHTSVSAYPQACMIPSDPCAGMIFTAADTRFLSIVLSLVTTLSELR